MTRPATMPWKGSREGRTARSFDQTGVVRLPRFTEVLILRDRRESQKHQQGRGSTFLGTAGSACTGNGIAVGNSA
jgi:hypothetical protein